MSNLWVNVEDLGAPYSDSVYAYDAVKTASYLLWAMSGRKYIGITTVTEKYIAPYDPTIYSGISSGDYSPTVINGMVGHIRTDRFGGNDFWADGSSTRSTVRLRGRKVIKIQNMRDTAGNFIPATEYYLADHSMVIATNGATWSPSNIEISYSYGTSPPTAGKAAARLLAIEFVKLFEGDDTCALPDRVTSVNRQGVSFTILDSQEFIDELKTGLYFVDMFLKTTNPDKARARSKVFSPDMPLARRVTPKPSLMTESIYDLVVLPAGGTLTIPLSEIGGTFLTTEPEWVLTLVMSDYTGAKSATLTGAAVRNGTDLELTVTYAEALAVLGMIEPGSYDIYCTRPDQGNPLIDEVVNLLSANLRIQLSTRITPIYTP